MDQLLDAGGAIQKHHSDVSVAELPQKEVTILIEQPIPRPRRELSLGRLGGPLDEVEVAGAAIEVAPRAGCLQERLKPVEPCLVPVRTVELVTAVGQDGGDLLIGEVTGILDSE